MHTFSSGRCVFAFDAQMTAAYWMDPGEIALVAMRDALNGQIRSEGRLPAPLDEEHVNPATGPIGVRGARPGQVLAVDVLDIQVGDHGYVTVGGQARFFRQDGSAVHFGPLQLPLRPMIGTIGVAPRTGTVSNRLPGAHGGNLDIRDVRAGSTVYLPVEQDGALLALGDAHSLQADGEFSGQGVETEARALIRVRVLDERLSDRPVVLWDGALASVGVGATLDAAARQAAEAMIQILASYSKLDASEARILLGLVGEVRIGQMVCPLRTARVILSLASIPWKRPLPL